MKFDWLTYHCRVSLCRVCTASFCQCDCHKRRAASASVLDIQKKVEAEHIVNDFNRNVYLDKAVGPKSKRCSECGGKMNNTRTLEHRSKCTGCDVNAGKKAKLIALRGSMP